MVFNKPWCLWQSFNSNFIFDAHRSASGRRPKHAHSQHWIRVAPSMFSRMVISLLSWTYTTYLWTGKAASKIWNMNCIRASVLMDCKETQIFRNANKWCVVMRSNLYGFMQWSEQQGYLVRPIFLDRGVGHVKVCTRILSIIFILRRVESNCVLEYWCAE